MTVKEVIALLQKFSPDAKVLAAGAHCGGYDVCWKDDVEITNRNGTIFIDGVGEDVREDGTKIWD